MGWTVCGSQKGTERNAQGVLEVSEARNKFQRSYSMYTGIDVPDSGRRIGCSLPGKFSDGLRHKPWLGVDRAVRVREA
jgi:hypothetical protein